MSRRLQIIVPDELELGVRKAAQRSRLSTSAWVRQVIEQALSDGSDPVDALDRLAQLGGPTADVDQLLTEIDAGRRG